MCSFGLKKNPLTTKGHKGIYEVTQRERNHRVALSLCEPLR